ncbi:hypothetical protein ACJMK2_034049 [Sinanodonta woodiana]|uniref:V-type proton ATPase subunit a n=1 Tax=Sinanodonta woodiana TaxID=1069815 RepID=A0ABD3WU56_SINWO
MGHLFRSEEMSLCQIFLQSEAAYACVSELGEMGLVQFKDLNPDVNAFQRKFVSEIMRCEEMERKLRYIEKELKKEGLKIPETFENPKAPAPKEMVDLEATFEKIESELREVNTNAEALKRNYLELTELQEVLRVTQNFFRQHGAGHHTIIEDAQQALVSIQEDRSGSTAVQLGFIAGVMQRIKIPAFERMLWFACRGNVFLKYEEIDRPLEDPQTGDEIHKMVFIVFFQGEQLKARVRKICEGFRADLYPCPETGQERAEMLTGVSTRLDDLHTVLEQTRQHRRRVLQNSQKEIHNWIIKAKKIKAIYHTLNMCNFDVSHNSLIAECWTPVRVLDQVQSALQHGTELSGSNMPSILHRMTTKEIPPTYNQTNKFTKVFQSIVNAYGVAAYREVNPAVYTIISFPFLFAIMFGDMGHGTLMFLFGLFLVLNERKLLAKKIDDEITKTFISGRYIIMMMGLFSVYTGFIYNDIFSKSFNIFGTSWHSNYTDGDMKSVNLQMKPETCFDKGGPYPMGLDPIWQGSGNKITFTNSFKMKLSVIFGILQMLVGVMLSIINHIHFRRWLNIICEFFPQLLFLGCLFGYLVAIIFFKWVVYTAECTQCAPSLLIHFINMFLVKYDAPKNETIAYQCRADITSNEVGCNSQTLFYHGQQTVQIVLLLTALMCVPCMLFIKPFVLRAQNNAKLKRKAQLHAVSQTSLVHDEQDPSVDVVQTGDVAVTINGEVDTKAAHHEEDEEKFEFSEVFIHQAIHTIEYCLGCISHTASYLRLWALSLAHAQLSEVLWSMLFKFSLAMDLKYVGSIIIWADFAVFASLTVAILLMMEGMSAFLHTLRLHWVEFQSKFYAGTGYLFQPFHFKEQMVPTLED